MAYGRKRNNKLSRRTCKHCAGRGRYKKPLYKKRVYKRKSVAKKPFKKTWRKKSR